MLTGAGWILLVNISFRSQLWCRSIAAFLRALRRFLGRACWLYGGLEASSAPVGSAVAQGAPPRQARCSGSLCGTAAPVYSWDCLPPGVFLGIMHSSVSSDLEMLTIK